MISENAKIGKNVKMGNDIHIGEYCVIEDNVTLESHSYIDSNTIIRKNVHLGKGAFVGSHCIIGEYLMDFCVDRREQGYSLIIGDDALIRSGTVIYTDSEIGRGFQTGHNVTVREKSQIGNYVSIGTLSDVQGNCQIGNYVRIHSNVFIAPLTKIDNFVWIYPHVVLTNDPTPPSTQFAGVRVHLFAVIASGAIIMPGLNIGQDSLVSAGAVVTHPVEAYTAVAGNPARPICDIRKIKNHFSGEQAYPWRNEFKRYMPWIDSNFASWCNNLSFDEKVAYGLDTVDLGFMLEGEE